ncbi:MAG: hypothetical protein QMD77_00335 [Patescibacteria group bacterium]|nr:hypothetical protein [Patescibacteria group bacterium]
MATFAKAAFIGIIAALAAVIAEQFLAVTASLFFQREIMPAVYANLNFFLVAAAIIEEAIKYFAASRILRRIFGLERFKFIFAAVTAGLFFGLTEAYFILLSNGKKISDIKSLDGETLFSLLTVILTHVLTTLLISVLIAGRQEKNRLDALKTILPPTFVHLLVNFLIIQKGDFTNWLVGIVLGTTFVTSAAIIMFNLRELD